MNQKEREREKLIDLSRQAERSGMNFQQLKKEQAKIHGYWLKEGGRAPTKDEILSEALKKKINY